MSFQRGFGWGFGRILGAASAVVVIVLCTLASAFFGFPLIASAICTILVILLFIAFVLFLFWSGANSDGTVRRRKLVLGVVLVIWAALWLNHTTITRMPEPTNTLTSR